MEDVLHKFKVYDAVSGFYDVPEGIGEIDNLAITHTDIRGSIPIYDAGNVVEVRDYVRYIEDGLKIPVKYLSAGRTYQDKITLA